MNTAVSAIWIFLILATSALAGSKSVPAFTAKTMSGEKQVFVTGSLIPQRPALRAANPFTVSPFRTLSRREIDGPGRLTMQNILLTDPAVHVLGR